MASSVLTQSIRSTPVIRALKPKGPITARLSIRAFSSSQPWQLRTTEFTDDEWKKLRVNGKRLMEDIHHTCQWGTGKSWGSHPTQTGMSRLALSDADKQARDWFVETTQSLGCKTTVDAMGNIFAVRPGLREGPPTVAGSHLDTQPSGGRYDGILGVHAGVEMLRTLNDNWIETEFPTGVVNWTNEEGARFPISMVSSGVWAGAIPLETAYNLPEVGGGNATMKSELERIGYLGDVPASHEDLPLAAHFELHIEQGPILEAEKKHIGIVQGVQAYRWFTIDVRGRDCHTGTTPLDRRSDALLLTSKLILQSHKVATAHKALASTGILTLSPGSTNTVPGSVRFSLDLRAASDSTLDAMVRELQADFETINHGEDAWLAESCTRGRPCEIEWRTDSVSQATKFDRECIGCVEDSCKSLFEEEGWQNKARDLTSGAGHDSVYTSRRCPTSMIFVPCRDGVSHNPEEFCKEGDCEVGANVLMQSVLRFDRRRGEREGRID